MRVNRKEAVQTEPKDSDLIAVSTRLDPRLWSRWRGACAIRGLKASDKLRSLILEFVEEVEEHKEDPA